MPDIRILGIDPGTNASGVALLSSDYKNHQPMWLDVFTIVAKYVKNPEIAEIAGNRFVRLQFIERCLYRYISATKPHYVVYESGFNNPRMPGAFAPLVELAAAIRRVCVDVDPNIRIVSLAPKESKKGVKAKLLNGEAGKAAVRDAVLRLPAPYHPEIDAPDPEFHDEHSIDAMAACWTFYNKLFGEKEL